MDNRGAGEGGQTQPAVNLALAGFAGQVGCLTLAIVLAALFAGLWLDNQFHTRPLFTLVLVIGSVPVTLFVMFRAALGAITRIRPAPEGRGRAAHEEDTRIDHQH